MVNNNNNALGIVLAALIAIAGVISHPRDAYAIPTLQLGIVGGTYNSTTQTIFSSSSSFALYAFLLPNSGNTLGDTYYLSMAVTPKISVPANLGSFTYNGNTVDVTDDMIWGTPPIDGFSSGSDPGDLPTHSIFETYFKEVGFSFSGSQSSAFNTQDHPSWGPQSGSGMYYMLFNIDTSNLASGYEIHFDLYNTKLCTNGQGKCGAAGDTDQTQFAPFSHDAQSFTTPVPEPEIYAMLAAGLGLMGWAGRRRKQRAA